MIENQEKTMEKTKDLNASDLVPENREWTVRFPYIYDGVVVAKSKIDAVEKAIHIIASAFSPEQRENIINSLKNSSTIEVTAGRHRRIKIKELGIKISAIEKKIIGQEPNNINVGEGWWQIVVDCDAEISLSDPYYVLHGIGEIHGRLHYGAKCSNNLDVLLVEKINNIILKYQEIAARTCCITGNYGVLMVTPNGLYKTLDPKYVQKHTEYSLAGWVPTDKFWATK